MGVKAWFRSRDDDLDFELASPELLEFLLEDLDFLYFLPDLVSATSSLLPCVTSTDMTHCENGACLRVRDVIPCLKKASEAKHEKRDKAHSRHASTL